ncbi:MAG: dephospho-CoA kinase [Cyanobacteriota bacterium]|nr:dephospho-CoA kinase [Cyanobacteriota bacterium]
MRLIGITGGISTGKTTVSNYLKEKYQLPIWDADIYARQAVEIGSPILDKILERYGSDLVLSDGNLNRPRLGEIVFNQPEERRWLERQIHPYVRDRFAENIRLLAEVGNRQQATGNRGRDFKEKRAKKDFTSDFCKRSIKKLASIGNRESEAGGAMASFDGPTAVLAVPLLFEAQMTDLVTEIWVVYLGPRKQIERLMLRDGLSREQAIARINAGMSLEEKRSRADVVLDNSSTPLALLEQVDLAMAKKVGG